MLPRNSHLNAVDCPASESSPVVPGQGFQVPGISGSPWSRLVSVSRVAVISAAMACSAYAPGANAAGLGRLTVHSALGQALDADIDVPAVDRDEAGSLQVRLASAAAFKQANLEFNPLLNQLRLELVPGSGGNYTVHVSSAQAVNEPYLDLLLELSWAGGRVLREYTMLLDPPGLQHAPEIVAPGATAAAAAPGSPEAPAAPAAPAQNATTPPAAVPQQTAPVPAAAREPVKPAEAPTVRATAPAPAPKPAPAAAVKVKSGDTLGQIASANKPAGASLDQMLIALLRANPQAFIDSNINRLKSGAELSLPDAPAVEGLDAHQAHVEVVAQSNDFAAYRNRLAQSVQSSTPVTTEVPRAAGAGKVTTKVEDHSAAPSGDQLKIARTDSAKPNAKPSKDEQIARERALAEERQRAAALEKANADLKRANELAAQKAAAEKAAADKAAADKLAADKAAAAKAASEKLAEEKLAADRAAADKAAADKVAADKAAAAPAIAAPSAAVKRPPAAPEPGFFDRFLTLPVMGTLGGVLALVLVGLNVSRRRREASQAFGEDPIAANSLFGTVGGQSVDTAATSTFNSSFIPAASQLDSNEVDPVAEADVYIAYGREEQAEEILKESLRLQPERIPVRIKLLEIYARRGDAASFLAVAEVLHQQTVGAGDDWDRVAKMGRSLDPNQALYSGAESLGQLSQDAEAPMVPAAATVPGEMEDDSLSQMLNSQGGAPVSELNSGLLPETAIPVDIEPLPEAFDPAPFKPSAAVPAQDVTLDFGSLDFDLGPSKLNLDTPTQMPVDPEFSLPESIDDVASAYGTAPVSDAPTLPGIDLVFPPTASEDAETLAPSTRSPTIAMPDLDLDLPPVASPAAEQAQRALEEALSNPTLVGAVGAMDDVDAHRLGSNTDQATVPLIDFDLSGADAALTGRRTETQVGSPVASQMATKLALARGYIDLGVKDGARELLEEVMKDGTREQRQQAVELIKLVDA